MRRPLDSPTLRYKRQRALGATPDLALSVVLSSYGLDHNIVRLDGETPRKVVDFKWTLRQVEALFFVRTLDIGGPNDGAIRYPHLT